MIKRDRRVEGVVRDLLLTGETSSLVILQIVRKQVPDATLTEVRQARVKVERD